MRDAHGLRIRMRMRTRMRMTMTMTMTLTTTTITMRIWPRCCGGWPSAPILPNAEGYSSTTLSLFRFFACHVCLSPVSVCCSLPVDWAINHWFGKVKRELQLQPLPHKQRQQQSNNNNNNRNAALSVFRGFCTLRSCCQYTRHCALAIENSGQISYPGIS